MRPQTTPPQVHQEEREIVADVDARDLVVELDAVERRRVAVEDHDVAQVQIAVALADEAGRASTVEQLGAAIQLAEEVASEPLTHRLVEAVTAYSSRPAAFPSMTQRIPALPPVIAPRPGVVVEARHRVAQRLDLVDLERATIGEPVEELRLVEARHVDAPVDRIARSADGEQSVRRAGDGDDATIERRRGASIEPQLRFARGAPQPRGREVQVVEADRPLQLERPVPGQEHHRAVRVDAFHRQAAVRGRRPEPVDDRRLRIEGHDTRLPGRAARPYSPGRSWIDSRYSTSA